MGSYVYSIENVQDPTTVEVHACLQAIIFAKEIGFGDVCVKGDALTVLKRIETSEINRSIICNKINEIKK